MANIYDQFDATESSGNIYDQFDADKKPEDKGDFLRGAKESFQQLPQLGYGFVAGAGAALESAVGEGGIATGIKKAGVKGYQDWGDKIAADSKESDSFTYSYEKAKEGDFGAMVDWLQHGLGYAGGQGVQMLATAGIGAVVGKAGLKTAAEKIASGMVAKEAARIAATEEGAALAASQVAKIATANVASKIGQTVAVGAAAYGMEGGEIGGALAEQSVNEGRSLSGEELAKAFGATLAAGSLEFVGDKIGLDVMLGRSALTKPVAGMAGGMGRVARGALGAAGAAPIEGATEYGQTLLEEFGKGKDPFSEESLKAATDSAALGALGGTAMGGVGGVISSATKPAEVKEDPIAGLLENKPDPLISFPDGTVGRRADVENFIQSLPDEQRIAARARLFGLGEQKASATIADVTQAQSVDEAIAAAESVVSAPTEQLKNDQIDAAWRTYSEGIIKQREADFALAEQARREADIPAMEQQLADQQVEQANILTQAQGFDTAEPTAMQLALDAARAKLEAKRVKNAQSVTTAQGAAPQASPLPATADIQIAKPAQPIAQAEITQPAPASQAAAPIPQRTPPAGNPLMDNPASWVIREKGTGKVVMETFDQKKVEALNTQRYEAVPAYQHLVEVNDPNSLAGRVARGEEIKDEQQIVAPSQSSTLPQPMPESEVTVDDAPSTTAMAAEIEEKPLQSRAQIKTNTPEFKRFFKDSKVRDQEGRPLVVYHGTDADFSAFDPEKIGSATDDGYLGKGFYFSTDPRVIGKRAVGMPAYLRAENPLIISMPDFKTDKRDLVPKDLGDYDSVILDYSPTGYNHKEIMVRSPEQIKSATGNNGQFDPTNPDIRKSERRTPEPQLPKEKASPTLEQADIASELESYADELEAWAAENGLSATLDDIGIIQNDTVTDEEIDERFQQIESLGRANQEDSTGETRGSAEDRAAAPRREAESRAVQETSGLTAAEVNKSITRLRAKWIGFTKVNTVQSIADIPADLRKRVNPDAQTEGFYDPQTKSVYLIADNIASIERGAWVASHEVIGHGGLRMLKDKSVNEALNLAASNRFIRDLAKAIKSDRSDVSDSISVEEAVAEFAAAIETSDFQGLVGRYGVDVPMSAIGGIRGVIARVLDAVKRFLASAMGRPVAEVSDADVRELIGAQMEAVESTAPELDEAADAEPALQSRAPAPKMPDWLKSMPQETQDAAKKAGIWQEQKPLKDRLKELRNTAIKRIQQGVVDQFAPLKELGEHQYILARLTKSSDAPLESLLLYGKPFLNKAGAIDVELEKGGLIGSLQQLQGEHDRFFAWLAGNRASKLKAQGRENLFTDSDISALKDLSQGKLADGKNRALMYEKVRIEFNSYSKSVLDIAEKAGIINGADRSIWESDFYVPFYRVMEDQEFKGPKNVSGMVNQYAFKKLKGGTDNLNDLMENTLRNWSHLLSASLKNQASAAALKTAEKAGVAVEIGEKQKGSVFYLENGKQKHYMVEDPFLLDAITSLEWAGWNNPAMKWMTKAKHYLTLGVTISPTFKIRNLMRDQMAAVGLNPISYNIMNNLVEGWKGTSKESEQYAKMLAGGGLMRFGTFLEDDRAAHMKRLINDGVKAGTILDTKAKVKNALQSGFDWWQEVGDRSENITRAAIYKQRYEQAVKDGMSPDEAHLMASFAARDSMDFSLQGQWGSIRFLTQLVPFMNARLQGLYKLGRDGIMPSGRMLAPQLFGDQQVGDKAKAMRFGAVTGTVALASIALMLAYRDDDDWKNREEWDRDTYWWFKIGDTAYRIPKPFEIGAIGTIAERGLETVLNGMDKESRKLFIERLGAMISQTFSMNPVPQLVKPLIDLYANTDSFTGRPIETLGMERLSKGERVGQHTSATAQAAGKITSIVGLSPIQVDFLVNSYFSWLGTHMVMTTDFAVRPLMGLPDKPARRWPDDYFVIGDFAKDLPANQSRYMTKFYEQSKEVQQAMADIRYYQGLGNTVKARELMDEKRDMVRMHRMYDHAGKQLAEINKRIKIAQTRNMDATAKREEIDRLTQKKIQITKLIEERRLSRQTATQESE